MLSEHFAILLHHRLTGIDAEFVGLGEDYRKRHTVFSKPIDKLKVDFLWLVAYVDEHEKQSHLRASQDIRLDNPPEVIPLAFSAGRISVARQIHEIPRIVVDAEVVDKQCFARSLGSLCQTRACEHVDK